MPENFEELTSFVNAYSYIYNNRHMYLMTFSIELVYDIQTHFRCRIDGMFNNYNK